MNSLPKYVATRTPGPLDWNAAALTGDLVGAVEALKCQEGLPLLAYGSAAFVQTLLRHRLVDELRLIYPVVLGSGKRLFSGEDQLALEILESRSLGQRVVRLTSGPGGR